MKAIGPRKEHFKGNIQLIYRKPRFELPGEGSHTIS